MRPQFGALYPEYTRGCATTLIDNRTVSCLSRQKCLWQHHNYVLKWASTECQQSANNFWSCIMDNVRAMERHYPTIHPSAALIGKHASDDMASTSYDWAPTVRQQFSWGLSTLYCNELHCVVTKLSFTRSVFSICPCIQLHKYACNVSQIWSFCL